MKLGDRLRIALKEAGKTQQELADYLGISKSAVSAQMLGSTKEISAKNLFRAARFLGVEPEWLGTGKGPRTPGERLATEATEAADLEVRQIVKKITALPPKSRHALKTFLESIS